MRQLISKCSSYDFGHVEVVDGLDLGSCFVRISGLAIAHWAKAKDAVYGEYGLFCGHGSVGARRSD